MERTRSTSITTPTPSSSSFSSSSPPSPLSSTLPAISSSSSVLLAPPEMTSTPFFLALREQADRVNASLLALQLLLSSSSSSSSSPSPSFSSASTSSFAHSGSSTRSGDVQASASMPPSSPSSDPQPGDDGDALLPAQLRPATAPSQSSSTTLACRPRAYSASSKWKTLPSDQRESEVASAAQIFFADLLSDMQRLQTDLALRTAHFTELLSFFERQGTGVGQALGDGYFSALPDELFWHILSFLPPSDVYSASRVSRKWRLMCDDPLLWRTFYKIAWNEDFVQQEAALLAKLTPRGGHDHRKDDDSSHAPGSDIEPGSDSADDGSLKLERSANAKAAAINWKSCFVRRQIVDSYWRKGRVKSVSTLEGHSAWISCLRFNDSKIVSGAGDKTIRVWDMQTEKLEKTLKAPRGVLCLQFDEQKIVSGYMDNTIVIWDINEGRRINTVKGHSGRVWAVQFDDQKIVSGAADKTIKLWDLSTLQCTHSINAAHADGISCLQFNHSHIVSGAADCTVKVWDIRTYKCTQTLKGEHNIAVFCVALDDKTVLSGSHDSTIKQWDLRTGRCMHSYLGHQQGVFGVQFDPYKIVSCAGDHTIKIWDRKSGQAVATLEGHRDAIRAIQYDETKIVSGSSTQDKSIKIWRLA